MGAEFLDVYQDLKKKKKSHVSFIKPVFESWNWLNNELDRLIDDWFIHSFIATKI